MIGRLRRLVGAALDRRFAAVHDHLNDLAGRVAAAEERGAERTRSLAATVEELSGRVDAQLVQGLRLLAGDDGGNRRRLVVARSDPDFELAFTEERPLVTVIVPTFGRAELLADRMLPSILRQTYDELEILVLGDGPVDEAAEVVQAAADPRVRFASVPQRYIYPDPHRHWLAASTLTRNEGYRLARGRWLFDADDDDELPADAIQRLLVACREERHEAVQGAILEHRPNGSTALIEPTPAELPLKGALVHSQLRFFEREHIASALGVPGDWFRGERMVRAGVRIAFIQDVTYEYYPSSLWRS
jgi:hypothetical protein